MVPSEPGLQCETLRTKAFRGGGKGYTGPESERGPSSKEQLGESAGHTALLCHFLGDSHWELWVFQQFSHLWGGSSHVSSRKCRDFTCGS